MREGVGQALSARAIEGADPHPAPLSQWRSGLLSSSLNVTTTPYASAAPRACTSEFERVSSTLIYINLGFAHCQKLPYTGTGLT